MIHYDVSHKKANSSFYNFVRHTPQNFNIMKSLVSLALILGFIAVSCKKQSQPQPTHIDSLNTGDSMVTGAAQVTPDSGDNTLPMDSTAYDVDSIKNTK